MCVSLRLLPDDLFTVKMICYLQNSREGPKGTRIPLGFFEIPSVSFQILASCLCPEQCCFKIHLLKDDPLHSSIFSEDFTPTIEPNVQFLAVVLLFLHSSLYGTVFWICDDNVLIMGMFSLLLSGAYTKPRHFLPLTHPSSKWAGESKRSWEGTQPAHLIQNDQSDMPYPGCFALQEQLQEDEGMRCLMESCFTEDGQTPSAHQN